MNARWRFLGLSILLVLPQPPARAQRNLAGAVRTKLALERLNVLHSVMTIAAHPDDENTALLAYVARGRRARAAFLALTRGDGGQNLIGSEQLFESHDPNEAPLRGGTLYARYGKGAYVFTTYSWFRQLPAGAPGAFRIFANFLSAGRSPR